MKITKLMSLITSAVLLMCFLSVGTTAYFGDVNQYNNLPGQYEQNENDTYVQSPQPRDAGDMQGSETLNTAIAVILSVLGAAAVLVVVLGIAVRVRNGRD